MAGEVFCAASNATLRLHRLDEGAAKDTHLFGVRTKCTVTWKVSRKVQPCCLRRPHSLVIGLSECAPMTGLSGLVSTSTTGARSMSMLTARSSRDMTCEAKIKGKAKRLAFLRLFWSAATIAIEPWLPWRCPRRLGRCRDSTQPLGEKVLR